MRPQHKQSTNQRRPKPQRGTRCQARAPRSQEDGSRAGTAGGKVVEPYEALLRTAVSHWVAAAGQMTYDYKVRAVDVDQGGRGGPLRESFEMNSNET